MPHTLPRPAAPRATVLNAMERQLLETLARVGPAPVTSLPVRWPLIRMHVPVVLDRLLAAGLVRRAPSLSTTGGPVVVTERGRELLAQLAGSSRARTPFERSVRM